MTTWVRIEYCPGHAPISALSWSPYGNFLVSASPLDTNLVVWDVPMGVATKVQRSTGGGVTNVRWSPDGARVFAGCKSSLFRVWETLQWSCEKWTNSNGRCKVSYLITNTSMFHVVAHACRQPSLLEPYLYRLYCCTCMQAACWSPIYIVCIVAHAGSLLEP